MTILIVGGDFLGEIPENLKKMGFTRVKHVSGRQKKNISLTCDMALLLTDFVNHQLAKAVKKQAKREGKKVLFARRSWIDIARAMES